jgi:hypothetical protein
MANDTKAPTIKTVNAASAGHCTVLAFLEVFVTSKNVSNKTCRLW